MNKKLILAFFVLFLTASFAHAQDFCQSQINSVAIPSGAPIEVRELYIQSVELGTSASAKVRNISEKPIEQFFVSLTDPSINGLFLPLSASQGLPLSRQRELVKKGIPFDDIPTGDLRSAIGPQKEVFVHGVLGRAMANCPATLHISRMDVRFADHSWYHYKADKEEYSAARGPYIPPSILRGHPNLAENIFFWPIVVDKTGKAKVESISSPRPEDQEVFQKIVAGLEFAPALMNQEPQEEQVNVIVAIARSHLDYSKVKELLAKHGPSVVVVIEWEPRRKNWIVL